MLTNAVSLVDRLMHRAEVVRIEGESYRAKEADAAQALRQGRSGAITQANKMTAHPRPSQALMPVVPMHWTPEQALAVFECQIGRAHV